MTFTFLSKPSHSPSPRSKACHPGTTVCPKGPIGNPEIKAWHLRICFATFIYLGTRHLLFLNVPLWKENKQLSTKAILFSCHFLTTHLEMWRKGFQIKIAYSIIQICFHCSVRKRVKVSNFRLRFCLISLNFVPFLVIFIFRGAKKLYCS